MGRGGCGKLEGSMMAEFKFKKNDMVYFYVRPGMLQKSKIRQAYTNGDYSLVGYSRCMGEDNLFRTVEEAEKVMSPTGRCFLHCLLEAKRIFYQVFPEEPLPDAPMETRPDGSFPLLEATQDDTGRILSIAFELFNAKETE